MNVKLLSGDVYFIQASSVRDAKYQLAHMLDTNPYFLRLLHPQTGQDIVVPQDAWLLNTTLEGEEFTHFPRLFTQIDGFVYPILPPEKFREAIQGVDCVLLNETELFQMCGLFTYMCNHLHPYAYEYYFPMLSYYHIDDDEPEERLEWSLTDKVQKTPKLNLSEEDLAHIKGKLFENED